MIPGSHDRGLCGLDVHHARNSRGGGSVRGSTGGSRSLLARHSTSTDAALEAGDAADQTGAAAIAGAKEFAAKVSGIRLLVKGPKEINVMAAGYDAANVGTADLRPIVAAAAAVGTNGRIIIPRAPTSGTPPTPGSPAESGFSAPDETRPRS